VSFNYILDIRYYFLVNIYDTNDLEWKAGGNWSRRDCCLAASGYSSKNMEGKPTETAGDQNT
jgi:hypothetical protein